MLARMICLPPPSIFPFVADDPAGAVWRIGLVCALLLGADTLVLSWRGGTPRAAFVPLAGVVGCLGLASAAWAQSRTFIQDVCATSVHITDPDLGRRLTVRAQATLRLNAIYQGLAVVACVVTLVLLVWGIVRLARLAQQARTA